MRTEISNLNWKVLIEQYGSALELEKVLGIKYQTIVYHLRKRGLALSNKAQRRQAAQKLDSIAVTNKYDELNSLYLTAQFFKVAESAISKIIPEYKKKGNACTKYICNEDFFSHDNEQSFYWAGFIMADGCVKLKDKKYKQLSIGLAAVDSGHLEKFKKSIAFEGPISFKQVKNLNGTFGQACELTISSDKIFDSLTRFSIVPRKSLVAKFPEWLIKHSLVHHFMRGYFDGDGSIYTQSNGGSGRKSYDLSIRGTRDLLAVYRKVLEENTCVKTRTRPIRISSGQGMLEYGGNIIMQSIRNFLYKDATIWLDRKYAIFFNSGLQTYTKTAHHN